MELYIASHCVGTSLRRFLRVGLGRRLKFRTLSRGLPRSGGAVFGFEGVTLAFAASQWSVVAAVAVLVATGASLAWVHHRRAGDAQMRRPVPCQ